MRSRTTAARVSIDPPAQDCSTWIQVLDLDRCEASNVMPLAPEPWEVALDVAALVGGGSPYTSTGIAELSSGEIVVVADGSQVIPLASTTIVHLGGGGQILGSMSPYGFNGGALASLPTGGYVVAGELAGWGSHDAILRFSNEGELLRGFGFEYQLAANTFIAVTARAQGGIYIGGYLLDSLGSRWQNEWSRDVLLPRVGETWTADVTEAADESLLQAGIFEDQQDQDHVASRIAADGTLLWTTVFGFAEERDLASSVVGTADAGAFVSGWLDVGLGLCDLTRLDAQGGILWSAQYAIPGEGSACPSLAVAADGGFVATGHSNERILAMKVDQDGQVVWSRLLGPGRGEDIVALSSGGFAIAAVHEGLLRVLRILEDGSHGCGVDAGVVGTSVVLRSRTLTANTQMPVFAERFGLSTLPLQVNGQQECEP